MLKDYGHPIIKMMNDDIEFNEPKKPQANCPKCDKTNDVSFNYERGMDYFRLICSCGYFCEMSEEWVTRVRK